jgi:hypothetical protein
MRYVVIILGILFGVGLLFRLLTAASKRLNGITASEVADIIEKHIQGTEGPWDWDDFTSVPIRDDRLDAIRVQCLELDYAAPERRVQQLRGILEGLRHEVS